MPEQELINPAQADHLVLIGALLLTVVGALWGYRAVGGRGALAGLCGPLVFGMWQLHKYVTRFDPGFDPVTHKYDPSREYFGLDKVNVLLCEVVLALVVGAALGWIWSVLSRSREVQARQSEGVEVMLREPPATETSP